MQKIKISLTQFMQKLKNRHLMKTRQTRKKQLMQLCLTAVFTALTTVVTMFIMIPNPATGGYVNIGDCVVLIAGTILGPIPGLFAGGVGSAIADLATGYANWILPTFLIKGLEGFLCGLTTYFIFRHTNKRSIKLTFTGIASLLCALIMMVGYFLANLAMGGMGKAIGSLIPNTIQAVISFAINIVVVAALIKTPVFDGFLQDAFLKKQAVVNDIDSDEAYIVDCVQPQTAVVNPINDECVAINMQPQVSEYTDSNKGDCCIDASEGNVIDSDNTM